MIPWYGWTISGVLALLGLWAVGALVIGDRARGRRRCPKCWHSLDGLPERDDGGWVCPECGRAVRREKDLFRTRRKRGVIAVVAVTFLAGLGWYGYGVHQRWAEGKTAWVPTLGAIMLVRLSDPTSDNAGLNSAIRDVVSRRVDSGPIDDWHRHVLIWRIGHQLEAAVWRHVYVPEAWSEGRPIPIAFAAPDFFNSWSCNTSYTAGLDGYGAFPSTVQVDGTFTSSFASSFMSPLLSSSLASSAWWPPSPGQSLAVQLESGSIMEPYSECSVTIDASVYLTGSAQQFYKASSLSTRTFRPRMYASEAELLASDFLKRITAPSVDATLKPSELFTLTQIAQGRVNLVVRPSVASLTPSSSIPERGVFLAYEAELIHNGVARWRHANAPFRTIDISNILSSGILDRPKPADEGDRDTEFARSRASIAKFNDWVRWIWNDRAGPSPDTSGWSFRITPRPEYVLWTPEFDAYWVPADGSPYLEFTLDEIAQVVETERLRNQRRQGPYLENRTSPPPSP